MAKKSNLFGRADASLVGAAFREGMTRGPGDLSGPLKEQLNTNNMMWKMIGQGFDQAFGDTIAKNEEFKEATDKVMSEFTGGTAQDDEIMKMYDNEIKSIRQRMKGVEKGSLEERKLYAELERLKNSTDSYSQTLLNIGTFVKDDQHNPIATAGNLSIYNSIMNGTAKHKIENGKLLVSETGEEGTYKDFAELKKGMIYKDHGNHTNLLKYAETRQKEAKNNPKMIFDSQEGINYIETNNFKTREAFADIITTRVGNMKYSFLEAAYGKDRKVMDQIDGALAGVNTQNLVNKGLDKSGDGKISSADFTTKENKEAIIKAITDINDENFDFQVAKRVAAEFYNDGLVQPYYLRGVRNRATPRGRVDDKSNKFGLNPTRTYFTFQDANKQSSYIKGTDIDSTVESFKRVQDKGFGIFTGYDDVPHKLKNGKWFTHNSKTDDFDIPSNPLSIMTNLKLNNYTKIMDYLGIGSKKRRGFGMDDLSPTDDPFPFELNTDFSN